MTTPLLDTKQVADLDVDTDVDQDPTTDHDRSSTQGPLFHYVHKSQMVESAVMGTEVEALCGYRFPVRLRPKPGAPVCTECRGLFEQKGP